MVESIEVANFEELSKTEISRKKVAEVTGSDVLQLDLTSNLVTDQRFLDHVQFAVLHSIKEGKSGFFINEYFGNVGFPLIREGYATMNIGGKETTVNFSIPLVFNERITKVTKHPYYLWNKRQKRRPDRGDLFEKNGPIDSNLYPLSTKRNDEWEDRGHWRISVPGGVLNPKKIVD